MSMRVCECVCVCVCMSQYISGSASCIRTSPSHRTTHCTYIISPHTHPHLHQHLHPRLHSFNTNAHTTTHLIQTPPIQVLAISPLTASIHITKRTVPHNLIDFRLNLSPVRRPSSQTSPRSPPPTPYRLSPPTSRSHNRGLCRYASKSVVRGAVSPAIPRVIPTPPCM